MKGGPLSGVKVLDFTRILSGPYCTLLLTELGADVVKVERIDRGDDTRQWPPFLDESEAISTYFAAVNRGKRSLAIDLTSHRAHALLAKIVGKFDIAIENFQTGVAARLGIDHEWLIRENPAIITCSINGFGSAGPYSDLPASEIIVEALSGHMEITGSKDGPPVRFGMAMIDIAAGLTAAARILAALLEARVTGVGTHIEVPLYGTAVATLSTAIAAFTATGQEPGRWGGSHPSVVPYGSFLASDGHIVTGVLNDERWPDFCKALDLPSLAQNAAYATNASRVRNRNVLEPLIASQIRTRPAEYWLNRLRSKDVLAAPVRTVGAAIRDPGLMESGQLVELDDYPNVLVPLLGEGATIATHVPRLGEHTGEVLEQVGVPLAEIANLVDEGIIVWPRKDGHATANRVE